jgi:two-component system, NtrC family, sensor kinase
VKSLKVKLLFICFFVTMASLHFFGWSAMRHERRILNEELDEKMNALVENLAMNSAYGVLASNREDLRRLAENILLQDEIISVTVLDREGRELAEMKKIERAPANYIKEYSAIVMSEKPVAKNQEDILLDVSDKGSDEQIGKVKIAASTEDLQKKIADMRNMIIGLGITVLIFVGVIIILTVNTYITSPINKLISATKHVSRGDLDYRVDVKTGDEIGTLALFFNAMAEDLKISRQKIEEYNKTLEQKVEERTRDLKESHAKLFQAGKMAAIGQLAGGIAHEINNPMGAILGFSQVVVKRMKPDDGLYLPLTSIEREAKRCKKLIEDLLTFSRTGGTARAMADINPEIDDALRFIELQTRVQNIKIIREYAEGLPQIEVNKNQIQQVIINLCNNSLDAMPDGGTIRVSTNIEAGPETRSLVIKVTDNGKGMTPEVSQHVFEAFFTTKEVGKGTGLGLSLCYELIQQNNGSIDVESEANKGTTFIVKFPVT